ncbi:MAG: hypothetical protein ACO1NW_19725 [Chitinophagaceae bacterium]
MIREETRKKIFDYEAPPPPGAWAHIAASIGEKRAPQTVKIPVWVKYAASILLLSAAALIWWRVAEKSPETSIASGNTTTVPENSGVTIPVPAPEAHENRSNNLPAAGTHTYAQQAVSENNNTHTPSPAYVSHTASFRSASYGPGQIAGTLEKRLYREDGTDLVNENYIYLTTSDGNQVRVSRKIAMAVLADMGITAGETSSFETLQLSRKIRSWKAQLAESSFIPSASNMMDLLSLMEVLDKN